MLLIWLFSPVSHLSRSAKFIVFIILSFALHLLFFLVDFTSRPQLQTSQSVGVGLVQRSLSQFRPLAQRPVKVDLSPVLSPPEASQQSKKDPAIIKQQEAVAKPATLRNTQKAKVIKLDPPQLHKPESSVDVVQSVAIVEELVTSPPVTQAKNPGIEAMPQPQDLGEGQEEKGETVAQTAMNAAAEINPATATRLGFQDALPRYDLNPHPLYPEISRRRGQQGTVQLEVAVQADGVVDTVSVSQSSGYKSLDRAALTAVRRWRFRPATSAGLAVASRVVVPIDFILRTEQRKAD